MVLRDEKISDEQVGLGVQEVLIILLNQQTKLLDIGHYGQVSIL